MLTAAEILYQLEYWSSTQEEAQLLIYSMVYTLARIGHFFKDAKSVMDIGCGPYGGIFSQCSFPIMVGVDPLWKYYGKFRCPDGVIKVTGDFNRFNYTEKVDGVVVCNAINYCRDPFVLAENIRRVLNPGGHFILYDFIRDEKDRNSGNKRVVTKQKILNWFSCLSYVWGHSFNKDCYVGKYEAFSGAWTL